MRVSTLLMALVAVFMIATIPNDAFAGSKLGIGVANYGSGSSIKLQSALLKRHKKGVEYALDPNSKFVKLLVNVALKAALTSNGVPPSATDITLAIKRQIDRISYAGENGIDFQFVHESVAEILEVIVTQSFPSLSAPVTTLKLATAFMSAYTWGAMFGK